jgi:hypothetical protein
MHRNMRRIQALLLVIAACAVIPGTVAAGSGATPASLAFGRAGGNIQPFTITIAKDGSVTATGPVKPLRKEVSASALARLGALVSTQHFFSLSRRVNCAGSLPDFAYRFITVQTATALRTVLVRGGCRPGFNTLYAALSAAVGTR